jgi:hypothetical protein
MTNATTIPKVLMNPEIRKTLDEKGVNWIIAAIVEGSIGYYDPHGARRVIEKYIEGERQNFCERCYCLYDGDQEKMVLDDIRKFLYLEQSCPDRFKNVMKFIEAWASMPEQPFGGTIGLAYPTIIL